MAAKQKTLKNDNSSVIAGNELIELKSADGQKWYSYLPHAGNILVSWKNKNACCILLSVNWRHSRQTAELARALTSGSGRSGGYVCVVGPQVDTSWLVVNKPLVVPRASFFVFHPWTSEPQLHWSTGISISSCLRACGLPDWTRANYCSICNIEPSITKL